MQKEDLKIFHVGRLSLFADNTSWWWDCAGWFAWGVFSGTCASCRVRLGKGISLREQYLNLSVQMHSTGFLYINNSLLPEVNETQRLIQLTNQLMSVSEWVESFFCSLLLVLTSSVIQLVMCRQPAPFKLPLAEVCTRLAEITWDLWKLHLFRVATGSQAVCPKLSQMTLDSSVR